MRNPSEDNNPLDRASFYVESLKYGEQAGTTGRSGRAARANAPRLEPWTIQGLAATLEVLLRDAGVTSIDGAALAEAAKYYSESFASQFRLPRVIPYTIFVDGLMHGIALAAGIEGEHRQPKGTG